jgi:ankyrin repeat protein
MSFPKFANELLFLIAEDLGQNDLNHLLQTNRHLFALLTPLLEQFAVEDKDGLTALQWASEKGYEPLARLVLQHGADVNARNDPDGKMPLHLAADGGHEKLVRLLVKNRADIDAADGRIVSIPTWTGRPRPEREVFESWKREPGNTALHYASGHGNEGIVRFLLDSGANANVSDKHGQSALHEAARKGHQTVVQVLLDKGADIEGQGSEGEKPIHSAIEGKKEGIIYMLMERGAAVDAIDRWNNSVLHYASQEGLEAVVKVLLQKGSDITAVDDNFQTALHRAVFSGNPAVVKILLQDGVDSSVIDKYGRTALDIASIESETNEEIVWLLLHFEKKDIDNAVDGGGRVHTDSSSPISSGGGSSPKSGPCEK